MILLTDALQNEINERVELMKTPENIREKRVAMMATWMTAVSPLATFIREVG